eukprot:gnl/TRDRNA2_/TRDRNA2_190934_c0_seq1.p1 gnl/TRDRNA2_/TRDRNA2_190934_c0~~gnl/TRDRNA2_/TRDRNA2_190934_c0_seq1.p1  ORF type:complete len:358 (-),score=51.18 gnl/TRDRNA2_/TRDRNA2_190934_c0_seq1:49-1122(-)
MRWRASGCACASAQTAAPGFEAACTGEVDKNNADLAPLQPPSKVRITSLGVEGDVEVRKLIRRALWDAWPAVKRFGWRFASICELPPDDPDVGYSSADGTIFVKVRDPATAEQQGGSDGFCPYGLVLATLLHELSHISVLGHGKAFYRHLAAAIAASDGGPVLRREVRTHVCAELLNAVCDNDARRARALLAVFPEAALYKRQDTNCLGPLDYAAHHGRVALTRLLLEAGAMPQRQYGRPMPLHVPLARAAARGNAKTAALLLEARADVGALGKCSRDTVLKRAVEGDAARSSCYDSDAKGFAGEYTLPYGETTLKNQRSESCPTLPSLLGRSEAIGGGSAALPATRLYRIPRSPEL